MRNFILQNPAVMDLATRHIPLISVMWGLFIVSLGGLLSSSPAAYLPTSAQLEWKDVTVIAVEVDIRRVPGRPMAKKRYTISVLTREFLDPLEYEEKAGAFDEVKSVLRSRPGGLKIALWSKETEQDERFLDHTNTIYGIKVIDNVVRSPDEILHSLIETNRRAGRSSLIYGAMFVFIGFMIWLLRRMRQGS